MLAVTRRNEIKEIIIEKKSVIVSELAEKFLVTEETIRRDLKVLEDGGILTRTYGGAFVQDGVLNDINLSIRETVLVDNKKKIADISRRCIHNGDTIFLDSSTTSLVVAESIKNMRLTVLTNSLKIVNMLASCEGINLMCIGGVFSSKHMSFFGRNTLLALKGYYVDKAFISCRSLSLKHGVTDSSESLSEIRQAVLEHAGQVFLIADHSKFDRVSFLHICKLEEISCIITDQAPLDEWKNYCEKKKIQLLYDE